MSQEKKEVRFGGRTLTVTVTINTDEAPNVVAERLHQAGQGPLRRMTVTSVAEVDGDTGRKFWDTLIKRQPS